jgi:hypothetical protein
MMSSLVPFLRTTTMPILRKRTRISRFSEPSFPHPETRTNAEFIMSAIIIAHTGIHPSPSQHFRFQEIYLVRDELQRWRKRHGRSWIRRWHHHPSESESKFESGARHWLADSLKKFGWQKRHGAAHICASSVHPEPTRRRRDDASGFRHGHGFSSA